MSRALPILFLLSLFSCAFGDRYAGPPSPTVSLLDQCDALETLNGQLRPESSFVGFVDFSPTDSLLGFMKDYVFVSLRSRNLREMLHALTVTPMPELYFPGLYVLDLDSEATDL